jgi:hypothetical protein
MLKPWPEGDWQEWDCTKCYLEVPNRINIDGGDLIDFAAKQPDPKAFLEAMKALRS